MQHTRIYSTLIAVTVLATTLTLPGLALANGKGKGNDHKSNRAQVLNNFGIKVWEDGRSAGGGIDLMYKGTVNAVSATGFTMQTTHNSTMIVNTTNAKIVRLPHTTIGLSDVAVNDQVSVTGTVNGSTIDASVVFDLKPNLKPAVGKGTVTAITGSTVTVQTKNNASVTVNTDANTQVVKKDGTAGTVAADVTTGAKVKFLGLWDNLLNLFNAMKIKIK